MSEGIRDVDTTLRAAALVIGLALSMAVLIRAGAERPPQPSAVSAPPPGPAGHYEPAPLRGGFWRPAGSTAERPSPRVRRSWTPAG